MVQWNFACCPYRIVVFYLVTLSQLHRLFKVVWKKRCEWRIVKKTFSSSFYLFYTFYQHLPGKTKRTRKPLPERTLSAPRIEPGTKIQNMSAVPNTRPRSITASFSVTCNTGYMLHLWHLKHLRKKYLEIKSELCNFGHLAKSKMSHCFISSLYPSTLSIFHPILLCLDTGKAFSPACLDLVSSVQCDYLTRNSITYSF